MTESLYWLAIIAMMFLMPVAVLLPIIYGIYLAVIRKREGWRRNPFAWPDLLTPFVLNILWLSLSYNKSLSNLAFEPLLLGALWCVAWCIRLCRFSRTTYSKRKAAFAMLGIMFILTIVTIIFIPHLPE